MLDSVLTALECVVMIVFRCNPSLLIDYRRSDGNRSYILIDVGKTFREQVLRWFTLHKIPRVDSVSYLFWLIT